VIASPKRRVELKKFAYQIGVGGLELSELEKRLVNEVLDSNRLTYGPKTKLFEREFAGRHGCRFSLYMNSGTSALQVALAACREKYGWADGDEVILPAVTFVATCNVILQNGLTPVFVDVDPSTYNIDPAKIEAAITSRTRAIMPVHLLGLPADMTTIMKLAHQRKLSVIEDSAECMFATCDGKAVGSFGDIGCFSTYAAHILVTGVGGLATTNDPRLATLMRSLMNHGRNNLYISCTDDAGLEGPELEEVIAKRFSFERIGFSYRCTELEAAIGLGQLARADEMIRRRREIAARFTSAFSALEPYLHLPTCPSGRTHAWMVYGLATHGEEKHRLVNHLENLNIETRDLLPLTNQPVYRKLFGEDFEDRFPVAKWVNNHGFYIGCHSYMTDEEVDFVISAFTEFYGVKGGAGTHQERGHAAKSKAPQLPGR
jgi:dTDP-4-amino-4,6-dideoxygalactose transaminase